MMMHDVFCLSDKEPGQDRDLQKVKQIYIKTETEEVLLTDDSRVIIELMQDLKYKLATNQYWLVRAKNGDFIPYNEGGWELVFIVWGCLFINYVKQRNTMGLYTIRS
ncbi:hypothetical protein ACFQ88_05195 [Paenibacillus sp. NPDC056579]|uniref:hypothetical protein n=1 Tax=Paenibacillus sp. NPDC056579 TaxID=3345871 RepID=UPI0036C04135